MNIILFDTPDRKKLFPLTLTKAVADLRAGILTVKESWELHARAKVFVYTDTYLQPLYEQISPAEYLLIDATLAPSPDVYKQMMLLERGEAIIDNIGLVAGRIQLAELPTFGTPLQDLFSKTKTVDEVQRLSSPAHLFQWNEQVIRGHFGLVTKGRRSMPIPESVQVVHAANVFIEEGADISFSVLNASTGPIYIGKNAVVMEGCTIRGPFAMGEGASLKMGTRVYGGTTLGPYCVAGGEIKNAILMGYTNKGHDGYLGDSVIGEWCNLGAGTNSSNVKNTGGIVNLYDYPSGEYKPAGMKCGLVMGDYSRSAINMSFNTGTVVGVCSNVFGQGLTPKFIKDFSWGQEGTIRYDFDKVIKDVRNWKSMKKRELDDKEISVLKHIFDLTNY